MERPTVVHPERDLVAIIRHRLPKQGKTIELAATDWLVGIMDGEPGYDEGRPPFSQLQSDANRASA